MSVKQNRILIFGAGVIGSVYAIKFIEAGIDVTMFARSNRFKTLKENPWHIEGKNNKEWMLLDYIDVVAHVFRKDRREFYALEKLWGDAEIVAIEEEN